MGFFILRCLEDLLMAEKPTYEELEQRVKELEKETFDRKQTSICRHQKIGPYDGMRSYI